MTTTDRCVVCAGRRPHRGVVCETDRDRMRVMLAELPRKLAALPAELPPGQAPAGERVSTSRTGSPAGARLDVLTLTGPGSDGLSTQAVAAMLHPHVRRWSTKRSVVVIARNRAEIREVTDWHSEPVYDADGNPVLIAADDQVGLLPPVEWLDSWVRTWRQHFGHSTVAMSRRPGQRPARRFTERELHTALVRSAASPLTSPTVAWMWAVHRAWRQYAANTVLGLTGYVPPGQRPADPLAHEWAIRWGASDVPYDPGRTVAYLTTWLDDACDADVGIADFASELRSLVAELGRVLGDTPDHQWLGRCPAIIQDVEAGELGPGSGKRCGAGLWQDPYRGTYADGQFTGEAPVTCPRCRTTWGPKRIDLHRLAGEIRQAWPLDRRRRYARDELDQVPRPDCPGCGQQVRVQWRDVTGRGERTQWLVVSAVTCPNGCKEAERTV